MSVLGPDGAQVPCGFLDERDSSAWVRFLRLRTVPGVTWVWSGRLISEPGMPTQVELYY